MPQAQRKEGRCLTLLTTEDLLEDKYMYNFLGLFYLAYSQNKDRNKSHLDKSHLHALQYPVTDKCPLSLFFLDPFGHFEFTGKQLSQRICGHNSNLEVDCRRSNPKYDLLCMCLCVHVCIIWFILGIHVISLQLKISS